MGRDKKRKVKKREILSKDDEEAISVSGKMKVIFRVPPPNPSTLSDHSLVVSFPIEDIARAKHFSSGENDQVTPRKLSRTKKHKRKHCRHNHSKSELQVRAISEKSSLGYGSTSEQENDNSQKLSAASSHIRPLLSKGKDLNFHHLPGKEIAYSQQVHTRHFCDSDMKSDDDNNEEFTETVMSLPIQINLDMLSRRLSNNPIRPLGSGGKDMRVSEPPTCTDRTKKSNSFEALTLSTDICDQSGSSDDTEIRKKKKRIKHCHQDDSAESIGCTTPIGNSSLHDSTDKTIEVQEPLTPSSLKRAYSLAESKSAPSTASSHLRGVKLPRSTLRYFLKHLHHLIQCNDPEGVFAEPVTDDIAPDYSAIIKQPMDLQTMAIKIDTNSYASVEEFKDDFTLMCSNAMTYNTPETQYYQFSKQLLDMGISLIQKEISVRPDIQHGVIPTFVASPDSPSLSVSLPVNSSQCDYTSPFVCKLELANLRPPTTTVTSTGLNSQLVSGYSGISNSDCLPNTGATENSVSDVNIETVQDVVDQSYLTQVQVLYDNSKGDPGPFMFNQDVIEEENILQQADQSYVEIAENVYGRDAITEFSYLVNDESGRTFLNVLNPYSVSSCHPVNISVLADKVKAGNNASTVLKTELPVFKATPVSYLMYGPFGSFAPTYDTSFANLTKHDSALLLSTYGNELGITYANSLQQFVRGCGNIATEMADAILNSLTSGRHIKFIETVKKDNVKIIVKEKKDVLPSEVPATININEVKEDNANALDDGQQKSNGNINQELYDIKDEFSASCTIEEQLGHTSSLLLTLETEQKERLGQQSHDFEGEYILPGPSQNELYQASQVTSELASLTSQGDPGGLVSVSSLHHAMNGNSTNFDL